MALPIPHDQRICGICITIPTKMRTGVVRANVLADDTTACLALPFILLRLLYLPAVEHVVFRADEIHQRRVIVEKPHHQVIVHTLIMDYPFM